MAGERGRSHSPQKRTRPASQGHNRHTSEDDSILNPRQLEAFGRTVHATASHLIASNFASHDTPGQEHYRNALSTVHRLSQRPMIQRSVFSFAKANPRQLIRSKLDSSEIEQRALAYLPDELLKNVPESSSPYSLLDGFKASLPESESSGRSSSKTKERSRHSGRVQKLIEGDDSGPPKLRQMRQERDKLEHRLEMMGIRKTMCASEIREIDNKIANLNTMRRVILDRLAGLEDEERELEQEVSEVAEKLETMQDDWEAEQEVAARVDPGLAAINEEQPGDDEALKEAEGAGFMSESIYGKLPKARDSHSKSKRKKANRRISMPVLHEHMEPGSRIRELHAHNDIITAVDFDAPFGTMVTAALDDTVRVWDLNAGRCMGLLEGHLSSVRCLQVEDNIVATGSMDASIRLWDLSQADYNPQQSTLGTNINAQPLDEDAEVDADSSHSPTGGELFTPTSDSSQLPLQTEYRSDAMADCHMFTLSAHVAEITALNFRGNSLVSGSADKTLRQWDLEKGRCVQTLDVLWAAAQASTLNSPTNVSAAAGAETGGWWRPSGGRMQSAEADFVGALQVFETALACGTADGMVRLWDLRSGMVHRSLVGHTGPVTALQFDDVYVVTGSQDRSIRIWDLRTGNIHDAFAYDLPITSMQFDARRIVAAAGEDVVKVYDKADGRQWDCGAGVSAMESGSKASVVERVRIRDGYLVEGRRDGVVGVWSC